MASRFPKPPKKKLRETESGKKVYLVDGKFVREHIWMDFTDGGNHSVYPFVPEKELWIDDGQREDEIAFVQLHEDVEDDLMQEGWGYEDAHTQANLIEMEARKVFLEHKIGNLEAVAGDKIEEAKENVEAQGSTDSESDGDGSSEPADGDKKKRDGG